MYCKGYRPYYRNLVVGADVKIPLLNGTMVTAINFDNAATTPPFTTVLQEIVNFAPWYSSVHRGTGYKSQISSNMLENARLTVLNFVGADEEKDTVIFVKNSTEAINKLSYRLCRGVKECVVLSTDMEHHSNDLPWRDKYKVDYVKTDDLGRLSIDDLEYKLIKYKGAVKLVTVAGASNVTGYINPIHKIAGIAHKYKAKILVDGAQLVPHSPVSMRGKNPDEDIDYLVFSAHKMYAPFGVGVLIGPKETFTKGQPDYVGGGTVKLVTHDYIKWDEPPHNEEAGTPNIMGIAALTASIRTINILGMKNIEEYERNLTRYALQRLKEVPDIEIYGDSFDCEDRVGIITFNIKGIRHDIVAAILSCEGGIAVRNGCFCSQPYVQKLLNMNKEAIKKYAKNPNLKRPGMVRISFGLYNYFDEIDRLIQMLNIITCNKEWYIKNYENAADYMI